jgi:hypothetical protein
LLSTVANVGRADVRVQLAIARVRATVPRRDGDVVAAGAEDFETGCGGVCAVKEEIAGLLNGCQSVGLDVRAGCDRVQGGVADRTGIRPDLSNLVGPIARRVDLALAVA